MQGFRNVFAVRIITCGVIQGLTPVRHVTTGHWCTTAVTVGDDDACYVKVVRAPVASIAFFYQPKDIGRAREQLRRMHYHLCDLLSNRPAK